MKNLKKNNKGFSLVELIVVVLIIAIIAVALAPQVIKWVGEANKNTVENQKATIKSAVDTVVADGLAGNFTLPDTSTTNFTFTVSNSSTSGLVISNASGDFLNALKVALADFRDTKPYTVTIDKNYTVSVTQP